MSIKNLIKVVKHAGVFEGYKHRNHRTRKKKTSESLAFKRKKEILIIKELENQKYEII